MIEDASGEKPPEASSGPHLILSEEPMRFWIGSIVLALAVCGPVFAQQKPELDIAVYPGGEATMEINLTEEDLIPTLQAMLPLIKIGGAEDAISDEDIAAALRDVKRIEFLQLDIAKNPAGDAVADFYARKLPAGRWNRVFWLRSPSGIMALYVQGGGEKLYGFRVTQEKTDDRSIKRVQAFKTEGKIDYAKLIAIAAKVFLK